MTAEPPPRHRWLEQVDVLDRAAMRLLPRIRRRSLTPPLLAITYSGSAPSWFGAALILMALVHYEVGPVTTLRAWLACMTGSFGSLLVGEALKRLFRRTRPYHALADHEALGWPPPNASMPSTHASTSVALAVGLALAGDPHAGAVAAWAALVVFSRYYTGVHYPSDLAVGAALGGAFGLLDWTWVVRAVLGAPG
ncbi:MAG: phosphatase PAP2 family protein [bacterium]